MNTLKFEEFYNGLNADDKKGSVGIIELIFKDRNGKVIDHRIEKNIIKIFAKEMLSHRLPSTKIWNKDANGGLGAWESSDIDVDEEYSARYILFGASFDSNGLPLDVNDSRFYTIDTVTGQYIPIKLNPSADYNGGLINAIPISEPDRPLKRVESISFRSSYQPSGSPLIDENVRAINNIVCLETTLLADEYNGFGISGGDFFTITEIALAGGRLFDGVLNCDINPINLFLQGLPSSGSTGITGSEVAVSAVANGTNVVTIALDEPTAVVELFKKGDQIKIVNDGGTQTDFSILDQINSNYLVTEFTGGRDVQLDRVPVDKNGNPLTGNIGLFRDTLKIFSHRVLSSPIRKSDIFEITVRWSLVLS
jgi:hypothetical protein